MTYEFPSEQAALEASNAKRAAEVADGISALHESHNHLLAAAKRALLGGAYNWGAWLDLADAIRKAENLP